MLRVRCGRLACSIRHGKAKNDAADHIDHRDEPKTHWVPFSRSLCFRRQSAAFPLTPALNEDRCSICAPSLPAR